MSFLIDVWILSMLVLAIRRRVYCRKWISNLMLVFIELQVASEVMDIL